MWSPTHVQVLVKRAKGLNLKGKNGTNDAFVTIALGKEKFQTTVKEKATDPVEWSEQCELTIPSHGNTADISLTVLHRNFLGVDEFLGQVSLPLRDFDVYERPKSNWFSLKCKPGQSKNDYRGEIEVKLGFTVKATTNVGGGSVADLNKKNKSSISSLQKISGSISGSLMSLGQKERKSIKKIVKSIGNKAERFEEKKSDPGALVKGSGQRTFEEYKGNEDPGVNSDDEMDDCPDDKIEDLEEIEDEVMSLEGPAAIGAEPFGRRRMFPERSGSRLVSQGTLPPLNETSISHFREDPIKSTAKDQPPEERLKGSQSSLPSYNEATSGQFNLTSNNSNEEVEAGRNKKKIIPVQSDFESSSPSPDPLQTPPSSQSPVPVIRASVRTSQSSFNLARAQEPEADRTKKSLGMKLKTSYSSLLDLRKYGLGNNGSGFRDHSDLMGRVTPKSEVSTPVMARSRLPHDVLAQYNGKTREDLIEMVVDLKKELDGQGKKIVDLEDYIDNLLIKILDVAPILLKQDSPMMSKHHIM